MEGYLKVSPEKLRTTSSEFASEGTVVSSLTQQMMNIVTGLATAWEGEASSAYINKFKQLQEDINQINKMIQEHVSDLDEMAKNYETGEQKNTEAAGALPGDVIKDLFSAVGKSRVGAASDEKVEVCYDNVSSRDFSGWGVKDGSIRPGEYAYLTKFATNASSGKNTTEMEEMFKNAVKAEMPINHPLQDLNIKAIKKDGMDAFVIEVDSDHAIVVFAGTNTSNDLSDVGADIGLFLNSGPLGINPLNLGINKQIDAANDLISNLEKKYKNIDVTGYSLGGHLATDVTLKHDSISSCVTIDPPGRGDASYRKYFDDVFKERSKKITNYCNEGSWVSWDGEQVGKTINVHVKDNYDAVFKNHDIDHMINDFFGGPEEILYN